MPKKKKLAKMKVIHCQVRGCGWTRSFRRSAYPDNHVPKEKILSAIRNHYKKKHPAKFRQMYKKAAKTRRKKK